MFQATSLIAVVIITAQAFDLKRNQLPTNSLVNLGKIDVSVYYNTPNGKPEIDMPMNNDIFQSPLSLPSASQQSCPCNHMKSFGKDPSLSMLRRLFGGTSMASDIPQSPNCCDVFEIIDEDRPMDILPFQDNVESFQINDFLSNMNLPITPPKPNSQYRPKAVEIVIIPNKKNNKSKQSHSEREDIKVVGNGKKFFPKFKKINKSLGPKYKSIEKTTSPQAQSNFEYGIPNVEIMVESNPVKAPDASSTTLKTESENGPSVKKDLNAVKTTPALSTNKDVTTTRTSASPADADVL